MFGESVIERIDDGLDVARRRSLKFARVAGKYLVNAAQKVVDVGHDLVGQERYDVLKKVAKINAVSGCMTRFGMIGALNEILNDEEKPDSILVSYVDAINFKASNDRYGHHNGDLLLAVTGWGLREIFRHPEQHNSDAIVGSWGGDEFMCVLSGEGRMNTEAFGGSLEFFDDEGRTGKVTWNFGKYVRHLEETGNAGTSPIYNGMKHITDLGVDSLTYRFSYDVIPVTVGSSAEDIINTFTANNTVKTATHLRGLHDNTRVTVQKNTCA